MTCLRCDIKQDLKDENKPCNIRAKRRTFQAEEPANAKAPGLERAWYVLGSEKGPVRLECSEQQAGDYMKGGC